MEITQNFEGYVAILSMWELADFVTSLSLDFIIL